ncbi:MAG TPA: efflux RND transporter periplasmic adaptor subunit [bacterium]|jgi:Cu(I)/Ag(I) efflux system membrane fusion protein
MAARKSGWLWLIALIAVIGIAINVAHWAGGSKSEKTSESAERYTCPMHPTIIQDHPGDCPICGMKLVKMESHPKDQGTSSSSASKKIAFYRSPMDPKQTSPVPRKDEMGMDYIPVSEEEASGGGSDVEGRAEVFIDPSRQQLIGLRTAAVTRGEIGSEWRTVGRVQVDPTRVNKISLKTAGYVERIYVDFVGKPVKRGEPLFTYYSPDLLAAQQEFLISLKTQSLNSGGVMSAGDSLLLAAAKRKLQLWDVPESAIRRIEQTGEVTKAVIFISPVSGFVTAKNIVEGSSLNMGETAYEITNLDSVWIMADGYQSDAGRAEIGMTAAVSLESLPNRIYQGMVEFIDPVLDPNSRTYRIHIHVANPDGELKPDMFAEIEFQQTAHEALTMPADAIIPSGRGNMVFVALGDGKFQPRAVKLGVKSDDRVEVLEGLSEGESVVTRANFLVDSESSLRAALEAVGGAP